jgi:citrate synthase
MSDATWKTAVTFTAPDEIRIRGYPIQQLMGGADFGQTVYLLLRGELPDANRARVMTAILVSSVDHGPTAPSVLAARGAASTGATLNASVASGVLAINEHHGGAIEPCATVLLDVVKRMQAGSSMPDAARAVLEARQRRGERVGGFGHRLHETDPRAVRLFALADEAGLRGPYVEACEAMEVVLSEQTGRKRPINIDGAIAAVLCEMGFEPEVMNGVFILSRVAGLIAQAREEMTRERPLRRIDPGKAEYDGPPLRNIDGRAVRS